jgi:hypothetical protein
VKSWIATEVEVVIKVEVDKKLVCEVEAEV